MAFVSAMEGLYGVKYQPLTPRKIATGGAEFTQKEWDKLLEDFDDKEEEIIEVVEEETKKIQEERLQALFEEKRRRS